MKRMTPNRAALFIGVMAAVATLIYGLHYQWEQRREQAEVEAKRAAESAAAARRAAQATAAERAAFMARYINRSFTARSGRKRVAIAAAFGDEADRPITDALASHLKDENLDLFPSFFKPSFYTDGLFGQIFSGSTESIDKLQLTNALDALLLAREQVQYSTNGADLDNVITANLRLDVAFLPFATLRQEQSWSYTANGAGFSPGEARGNAEERLFKQITADTNMSLMPLSANNRESYP